MGKGTFGAVFAAGVVVLAMVLVPAARWWVLGAAVLGGGIAAGISWWNRTHPVDAKENPKRPLGL